MQPVTLMSQGVTRFLKRTKLFFPFCQICFASTAARGRSDSVQWKGKLFCSDVLFAESYSCILKTTMIKLYLSFTSTNFVLIELFRIVKSSERS